MVWYGFSGMVWSDSSANTNETLLSLRHLTLAALFSSIWPSRSTMWVNVGRRSGASSQQSPMRVYISTGQSSGHSSRCPPAIASIRLPVGILLYGTPPRVNNSHRRTPKDHLNSDRANLLNLFTPMFKKYILPNVYREMHKCTFGTTIIIFRLSKLWKAKFFICAMLYFWWGCREIWHWSTLGSEKVQETAVILRLLHQIAKRTMNKHLHAVSYCAS